MQPGRARTVPPVKTKIAKTMADFHAIFLESEQISSNLRLATNGDGFRPVSKVLAIIAEQRPPNGTVPGRQLLHGGPGG